MGLSGAHFLLFFFLSFFHGCTWWAFMKCWTLYMKSDRSPGWWFFVLFCSQKVHLSRVHKQRGVALLTLVVGWVHSWPGCRAACLLVCLFVCSFARLQIPLVFLSPREVSNWNSTYLPHPLLGGTEVSQSFWSNTCQLQARSGTAVAWINSIAFFMQFWFSWLNSDCLPVLE